jgi:hypothetical protein
VWQPWTKQDLDDLTLEEIEILFAHLTNKLYDIENQFLEETAFYSRNRAKIDAKDKRRGVYYGRKIKVTKLNMEFYNKNNNNNKSSSSSNTTSTNKN